MHPVPHLVRCVAVKSLLETEATNALMVTSSYECPALSATQRFSMAASRSWSRAESETRLTRPDAAPDASVTASRGTGATGQSVYIQDGVAIVL